jgi:hypothetical protein
MSNSKLVTYTKLSPNRTKSRKNKIDTITIHCIVGQWTAKQGCDFFASSSRQCSANYVVGKDGSIGLSVDERDRSWCSSSAANDHRAVTIEVASDTKHPYAVTAAAYEALIKLVADICKRNNIEKLVWSTNKSDRVNRKNGCNMTVHRDFASKSCPGEYLYSRHGDIADKVNAILGQKQPEEEKPPVKEEVKDPIKTVNPEATYRAYAKKWYGEIKNYNTKDGNGYAGIQGKSMTALVAKSNVGTLKYRVHIKGKNWLSWISEYNIKDAINGYAGVKGKEIDAVQMVLEGTDEYAVRYRVSPKNSKTWYGWYTNLKGSGNDDYAGVFGKPIDCIQIEIVKK